MPQNLEKILKESDLDAVDFKEEQKIDNNSCENGTTCAIVVGRRLI